MTGTAHVFTGKTALDTLLAAAAPEHPCILALSCASTAVSWQHRLQRGDHSSRMLCGQSHAGRKNRKTKLHTVSTVAPRATELLYGDCNKTRCLCAASVQGPSLTAQASGSSTRSPRTPTGCCRQTSWRWAAMGPSALACLAPRPCPEFLTGQAWVYRRTPQGAAWLRRAVLLLTAASTPSPPLRWGSSGACAHYAVCHIAFVQHLHVRELLNVWHTGSTLPAGLLGLAPCSWIRLQVNSSALSPQF